MDLTVEEYVEGLFSEEAHTRPSDHGQSDDIPQKMHLPKWFDEEKYNQGRRFFWDTSTAFFINTTIGLVAILAVPSILKILLGTHRSNSAYTSYKRYLSTFMHFLSWHRYDLKPGTTSWRSLETVRTRHLRAGQAATLKGRGTVSQRDLALTQFGFIGFAVLKPDKFSIRQLKEGDWEAYNHLWRTIGYMIGIEDRYNICRNNIDETREVCQILLERVFTPCLENVPEYYEHTVRVLLDGLHLINGHVQTTAVLFSVKYLAEVPGYVYTEEDRITFQNKLKKYLNGKSEDLGIDAANFISKPAVGDVPKRPPRLLYVGDYDMLDTIPALQQLDFAGRYGLVLVDLMLSIYSTYVGRIFFNLMYDMVVFFSSYFPYRAFVRFGLKKSYVNMFNDSPKDGTVPKPNSEYEKPPPPETWYEKLLVLLW